MCVATAHSGLVLLNPETDKQIWVFTHKHNAHPPRGIAYWLGDRDNAARLLFGSGTSSSLRWMPRPAKRTGFRQQRRSRPQEKG